MFNRLKAFLSGTPKPSSQVLNGFRIEDFAEEFLSILKKSSPSESYSYDNKTHTINDDNENDGYKVYLGNIFNNTKNMTKDERLSRIKMFIHESQNLENISETLLDEKLFYRLRTESEISNRKLYINSSGSKPRDYFAVGIGELRLELVVDQKTTIRVPTLKEIQSLGTSTTDALTIAHKNMKSITNSYNWTHIKDNIWQSNYEDDYDGARLVSLYPEMSLPFSGSIIAFMPSHSICLITEDNNTESLGTMIELGNKLAENQRKFSDNFWSFENGGWVAFELQETSPEAYLVKRQNLIEKSRCYAEQKEQLNTVFEKEGVDIFVASYQALEDENDGLFSYSVLSLGVETLLPRTEKIFIVDPSQAEDKQVLGNLPWDELVNLLGKDKFILYQGLVPPLYDLVEKLDKGDFIKIRNHML